MGWRELVNLVGPGFGKVFDFKFFLDKHVFKNTSDTNISSQCAASDTREVFGVKECFDGK